MVFAVDELSDDPKTIVGYVKYVWCRCQHDAGQRCACGDWDGKDNKSVCPGCDRWGVDALKSAIKTAQANEEGSLAEELEAVLRRWRWWRRVLTDAEKHPERVVPAFAVLDQALHSEARSSEYVCTVRHRHCIVAPHHTWSCRMMLHEDDDLAECLECTSADGQHQLASEGCLCEHHDCRHCGAGFPLDERCVVSPDARVLALLDGYELYGWVCEHCRRREANR